MVQARVHLSALAAVLAAAAVASVRPASAGIEDWQLNEVMTSAANDPRVRYVELYNGVGGCLFASTRLIVYGADGAILGSTSLTATTVCHGAGTYFLVTTPETAALLGTAADRLGLPPLPVDAGQVCFSSTSTRYDCVRWGVIDQAVTDLFGAADTSAAAPPGDGRALSRVATTHIVMDDWLELDPTPRGPNDGAPWTPPDAGPTSAPDAGPDGGPIDASPPDSALEPPDAEARPDARDQRFLDLDPGGGATCGCRVEAPPRGVGAGALALWSLAILGLVNGRRHPRAPIRPR